MWRGSLKIRPSPNWEKEDFLYQIRFYSPSLGSIRRDVPPVREAFPKGTSLQSFMGCRKRG